jgi:hypothetical protein
MLADSSGGGGGGPITKKGVIRRVLLIIKNRADYLNCGVDVNFSFRKIGSDGLVHG